MKKILFALSVVAILLNSNLKPVWADGSPAVSIEAQKEGNPLNVAYAEKVYKLGEVAEHYNLKLVTLRRPGEAGVRLIVGAVAGEFDEKVWEIPSALFAVRAVTRVGLEIKIQGIALGEDGFSAGKAISIKMTLSKMPDEPDQSPMLESTLSVVGMPN